VNILERITEETVAGNKGHALNITKILAKHQDLICPIVASFTSELAQDRPTMAQVMISLSYATATAIYCAELEKGSAIERLKVVMADRLHCAHMAEDRPNINLFKMILDELEAI
jgi:hypothetical protein